MERCQRFGFVLLAAVLLFSLFYSGHDDPLKETPVAFLTYSSLPVLIKVTGEVHAPGIYHLPHGTTAATVINLTAPYSTSTISNQGTLATVMQIGDVLHVRSIGRQHIKITFAAMKTKERMILGVPLNQDIMDSDDWEILPGIGPVLAKKIIDDRQKYGEFGNLKNLQRVPGIGKIKINKLSPYFRY